jgi:hypothetical protein
MTKLEAMPSKKRTLGHTMKRDDDGCMTTRTIGYITTRTMENARV